MRYLNVFLMCFLLSGARADVLGTLQSVGSAALDYGKQALQSALDTLTTSGVKTLIQTGVSALMSSLFGRREVGQDHLKALEILKQEAQNVENVLKSYSSQLQQIYDDIHSLAFLKGDVLGFLSKIQIVKDMHNNALDSIVKNFIVQTSALNHNKRALTDFLTSLQTTFTQTVSSLKQTFGGVTDQLNQQSGGLLGTLVQGLTSLNTGLAEKFETAKQTAAQLLATGQESLASLHETGSQLVHQTVEGLKGQAQQAVDTLLHPGN